MGYPAGWRNCLRTFGQMKATQGMFHQLRKVSVRAAKCRGAHLKKKNMRGINPLPLTRARCMRSTYGLSVPVSSRSLSIQRALPCLCLRRQRSCPFRFGVTVLLSARRAGMRSPHCLPHLQFREPSMQMKSPVSLSCKHY